MQKQSKSRKTGYRKSNASKTGKQTGLTLHMVEHGQVPVDKQRQFVDLHNDRRTEAQLAFANELTVEYPRATFAWKALGTALLRSEQFPAAEEALRTALSLTDKDPEIFNSLARSLSKQNRDDEAVPFMKKAIDLKPDFPEPIFWMADHLAYRSKEKETLEVLEQALSVRPDDFELLVKKATSLVRFGHFADATTLLESLLEKRPDSAQLLASLGSVYYNVGRIEEAETAMKRGMELHPENALLLSNYLLHMHYNPSHSAEFIHAAHLEWDSRFRPSIVTRAEAASKHPDRRIRVGMISAGFRIHPVGQMIASALQFLPREDIEIYCYTMNNKVDPYTRVIQQRADKWQNVFRLQNDEMDRQIRQDRIDILLDLSGHTEGSRSLVLAMEPAPLQIKWVGGQINTTGLTGIDYMLSDSVETPPGIDKLYVEKLIRLPDDYICYVPRSDTPPIGPVPATENDFVTFGCFNNPVKINPVILRRWADLLHQVPNSKLFLKGSQYDSKDMVARITQHLEDLGIDSARLIIETRSPHVELLNSYNRVDIALDPWPYSGGLTTCEALLMGVPVITLPGPTFAGRHSATHLVNAGLPEMVVETWEEYVDKAVSLAGDVEALAAFRRDLRKQLQQSPVCDAHRFGRHLNMAFRAIWQRYCEGKAPAALTFEKSGTARFDGEDAPVSVKVNELANPRAQTIEVTHEDFDWDLPRQIVVMDNGGKLFCDPGFDNLRTTNAFAVIGFDPASRVGGPESFEDDSNIQLFPHALLGNGEPTELNACLDPDFSSTLSPLPAGLLPDRLRSGATVLTKLPINTVALDSIDGLEQIDWLILDERSDVMATLRHGENALKNTLILQVRVSLQARYFAQVTIGDLVDWATDHGFCLYRMNNPQHTHLGENGPGNLEPTQLESVDLLFIPSAPRMTTLSADQQRVLGFLLHAVFNIRDLAHHLLGKIDDAVAEAYLRSLPINADAVSEISAPTIIRPKIDEAPEEDPEVEGSASVHTFSLPAEPHMSPAERLLFQRSLDRATSYFEYGAGGSTVWAVKAGLEVYGVESDATWVSALKDSLGPDCRLEAVDIGPTGAWGMPVSRDHAPSFPAYSASIEAHQRAFDLILVDGRFRVACTMKAIEHLRKHPPAKDPGRLFIHDFWNRPQYHVVLRFLEVIERVESAGLFAVKPGIDPAEVLETWEEYSRVPN